ncbi:hypothetical protein HOA92_03965 [archaeon]|jgi:hypothetical protein|nr:hypothetical protein [archaeon]
MSIINYISDSFKDLRLSDKIIIGSSFTLLGLSVIGLSFNDPSYELARYHGNIDSDKIPDLVIEQSNGDLLLYNGGSDLSPTGYFVNPFPSTIEYSAMEKLVLNSNL